MPFNEAISLEPSIICLLRDLHLPADLEHVDPLGNLHIRFPKMTDDLLCHKTLPTHSDLLLDPTFMPLS
jgi:hypothetical protein